MRFVRAILTRPATFTFIFLIANIFIFLLTVLSARGTDNEAEFNATLIAYGAKVNALININGEWWRFVTPIFLHGGFAHLFMNMYGLWILGPYVERLYGSAKFVVFWVATGVAGVLASYLTVRPGFQGGPVARFLFKSGDVASVGASGALFGLIGVLFVFGIKFRHELPEGFKRAFCTGMLPTILLNIFIGYVFPFIDNAAHMGGLMAGATLALLVGYKRPGERAGVAIFWHALQVAALALVVVSFVEVALHFRGNPPTLDKASLSNVLPGAGTNNVKTYIEALNQGQVALVSAIEGDASGVDEAVKALEAAPHLDERSDALREDLKSLLKRAGEYAALSPQQRKSSRGRAQLQELIADVQAWQKDQGQWLKSEGQKYGIQEQSPDQVSPERK